MDSQTILNTYKTNKSCYKTAEELGITRKRVLQVLSLNNIVSKHTNSGNKKHNKNTDFFSKPNLLNSYWAGFIAADGHISQDNGVIIALAIKDIEHLEKFKACIEYSGQIRRYKHNTSYGKLNYCRVSVYAKKLCQDLGKNWKIVPNKTKTLEFPSGMDKDVVMAYILGYIDGDGSFNFNNGVFHSLNICGHYKFLEDMRVFLSTYLEEPLEAFKIYPDHSIFKLNIARKNVLLKFRNTFLEKFKTLPYMERKWIRLIQADLSKGRI